MLVLAAFLSICAVGVAFLLRFLFAVESDLRSHGKHSARVDRIRTLSVPVGTAAWGPAPPLILVHSNEGFVPQARPGTAAAAVRANEYSRIKQA
jgi:hypothetical protein